MNPIARIGPYLYAAAHAHNAVRELVAAPRARRIAARDAAELCARFPFLADYTRLAADARTALLPAYADYTASVSPAPITIALDLAVFLRVLCQQLQPRAILDLGSGFSSYVFRSAPPREASSGPPAIYSVDDSRAWLEKTRAFLAAHHLDAGQLATWDDLRAARATPSSPGPSTPGPFDLVLHDIATLDLRLARLDDVIDSCRPGAGWIVIDDMHVPWYRRAVLRALEQRRVRHFSLRAFTRRRLRYSYLALP
jgi:predicted O-methyltransferase YrrM